MKALILAAGFGTRLLPYTQTVPKPLFTLGSVPLVELAARQLCRAGCREIWINTHYLAHGIEAWAEKAQARFPLPLNLVHEPRILETGGAMVNLRDQMGKAPFWVVNADVVSNIDLEHLYRDHVQNNALATLALHHRPKFNKVKVDNRGAIQTFEAEGEGLAFTGIQVISPELLDHAPGEPAFSSIPLFESLCSTGRIRAHVVDHPFWEDIGSPDAYRTTARQWLCAQTLAPQAPFPGTCDMEIQPLAGDGSDREWYRAQLRKPEDGPRPTAPANGLILSDHGISVPGSDRRRQLNAFVAIGDHLHGKGVPVPRILSHDAHPGLVTLEDLGDTHLASAVQALGPDPDPQALVDLYTPVIQALISFSQRGKQGFNTDWTCQTPTYSKELILEMECGYFLNAFVKGYCGKTVEPGTLAPAFEFIADQALAHGCMGLMHRDCQSRNIMIKDQRPWFIDFQSARLGPLQYDLASLLIDPYVQLPKSVQTTLVELTLDELALQDPAWGQPDQRADFIRTYGFCCLTRNLQALGAFGFLTKVKGKTRFKAHIPPALDTLAHNLQHQPPQHPDLLGPLRELVNTLRS